MLVNTALKFKYVSFTFNFSFPAGIIDSCVEQMKQTHSQLQLESVRPGKASRTKKVSTDFQEMFFVSVLPMFCPIMNILFYFNIQTYNFLSSLIIRMKVI